MLLKKIYNPKIESIEDKIPDITNLAINASLNAKINEIKDISNLATNDSLNAKMNEPKGEIPNLNC